MTKKKFLLGMLVIALTFGFVLGNCSKDDDTFIDDGTIVDEGNYPAKLTINSDGKGSADVLISEGSADYETENLKIMQVVPDFGASSSYNIAKTTSRALRAIGDDIPTADTPPKTGSSNTYPANSPIIIFFDDVIYIKSIDENFEILVGDNQIYGTISISSSLNEKGKPRAILTFMPYKDFEINKGVSIKVKKGLQDKCGNGMSNDKVISFTANKPSSEGNFTEANWGFEADAAGVEFIGDGKIFEGAGSLSPKGGSKLAAISSGDPRLTTNSPSVGNKASFLKLGPINTKFSKITLWYDFISAEFNTYVGSIYNDEAVITIYGPTGTVSVSLAAVNTIGKLPEDKKFTGLAGGYHTDWTQFVLDNVDVGTPAYIIFTVSDIGDTIYDSVLAVDDINLSGK